LENKKGKLESTTTQKKSPGIPSYYWQELIP